MLYPAELQALPQPRLVRLAQDFSLCLLSRNGRDGREKREWKFAIPG
jgi:hypothetical protein